MPQGKTCFNGIEPSRNAGFPSVDFLTSAHKTNHYSPVIVSVEVGNEKLGLRLGKTNAFLFPEHEVCGHLAIPCPLSFIEDDHMVSGCDAVAQPGIAEVMHILDECFDFLFHHSLAR